MNNEYNAATSTFRPKTSGIYSLVASISFSVITLNTVIFDLEIRVNGTARISDREFFPPRDNVIDAAGIVKLEHATGWKCSPGQPERTGRLTEALLQPSKALSF